ncbi:PREDICTED: calcium-binding protein 5 [Colobus angolensis palliatus]|uniref:calcium-binding protein 5 n=1 Tax=Colobus angolensis palliatus TaxID=336983 RepID=UPI0005F5189D|nr:PREDICTED: calcium-binding protein 5 [Colobus angolensis palliatus]
MQFPMGPACIFLRKGIAEKQRERPLGQDEIEGNTIFPSCPHFDTNGDGEITLAELQQAMQRLLGERLTPREISDVVREADVNGDGTVDFEEFVKMMSR